MQPYAPYRRYRIGEADDRRSSERHRPLTIAIRATRPMHLAHPLPAVADWPTRLLPALRRLAAMIGEWRRRARSRRELLAFDERMLRDIGVTRIDVQYEAAKPFWR
jgi:uncharacterized protein YjiS (DUF1127 family)